MTILLVDDEKVTLEAIHTRVDWQALGIDNVLEARDAGEARLICTRQQVALLLCDIEMPGESGISLMRWARLHCPEMICLLLTGHAEFDYARQAVELGAFEYLLKPVGIEQLTEALKRAGQELHRRMSLKHQGLQWEKNQDIVVEQFWTQLILGHLSAEEEELKRYLVHRGLETDLSKPRRLILCAVHRRQGALSAFQEADLDFLYKNILSELFTHEGSVPLVLAVSPRHKLVLADACLGEDRIKEQCHAFFSVLKEHFRLKACFYMGESCLPVEMEGIYRRLSSLEQENVAYENRIYRITEQSQPVGMPALDTRKRWENYLEEGQSEALTREIWENLEEITRSGRMNRTVLVTFFYEIVQLLGAVLARYNIPSGQALDQLTIWADQAFGSVEEMRALLSSAVAAAADKIGEVRNRNTVVEKVKQYIREHVREDLSRDILASVACLNPSYLSRLFHAQTGESLVDYVTGEKISQIQQLLRSTERSVSDIALEFGYTNMPYFSQVFRKAVGCSPVEYRKGGGRSLRAI